MSQFNKYRVHTSFRRHPVEGWVRYCSRLLDSSGVMFYMLIAVVLSCFACDRGASMRALEEWSPLRACP